MDLSTVETVGLITEKRKNKAKYLTWNTIRLSLWRNSACRTLPKALDRLSATARVAPDLLKAQTILSGKTARRSFIDWEYLKPYWKSEKRARFSKWSRILWFTSFLKDVTNHSHRKKTNRVELSPTFLNTGTTNETFLQYGKQDSFRHSLKSSAST